MVETEGSIDGGRVRFIVTQFQRSGPTVILNARLELADPAGESPQVASSVEDGIFQKLPDGGSEPGDVFDGVALIDPEGRKKYLVARDETNRCVCSNDLGAAFVSADAPVELAATLAAPPRGRLRALSRRRQQAPSQSVSNVTRPSATHGGESAPA